MSHDAPGSSPTPAGPPLRTMPRPVDYAPVAAVPDQLPAWAVFFLQLTNLIIAFPTALIASYAWFSDRGPLQLWYPIMDNIGLMMCLLVLQTALMIWSILWAAYRRDRLSVAITTAHVVAAGMVLVRAYLHPDEFTITA